MPNGINKALAIARSVAKKGTKVFADALPLASIGANVVEAYQMYPTSAPDFLNNVIMRYTGINPHTGSFSLDDAKKGLGTLLVSVGARYLIKAVV